MDKMLENGLIPVYEDQFNNKIEKLVDARELHNKLNVGKDFSSWIKNRIEEYGYKEGLDFSPVLVKSTIGRPKIEYVLKMSMAKELCVVENNEIGRAIRKYLLDIEEKYRIPMTYEEALEAHLAEVKKNRLLQEQNKQLVNTIEEQKIVIENQNKDLTYLETIKGSPNAIKISQMAGDYGCSPQDMNNILVAIGFQKKVNDQWLPKGDFAGHKLTVSTTIAFDKNGKVVSGNGECVGTKMQTLVTQKGRYRIYQFLKEIGIVPEVEMKNDNVESYELIDLLSKIGRKMIKQGMRFKTEIPKNIEEKIKIATKNFVENEKVKIELCIDEEGKESEIMVDGWQDIRSEEERLMEARPWLF